jgi:hypothetical protein
MSPPLGFLLTSKSYQDCLIRLLTLTTQAPLRVVCSNHHLLPFRGWTITPFPWMNCPSTGSMGVTSAPTKALSLSQVSCRTGSFSSIRKMLLLRIVISSRRVKLPVYYCASAIGIFCHLISYCRWPILFHAWIIERVTLQRQREFNLFRESTTTVRRKPRMSAVACSQRSVYHCHS